MPHMQATLRKFASLVQLRSPLPKCAIFGLSLDGILLFLVSVLNIILLLSQPVITNSLYKVTLKSATL